MISEGSCDIKDWRNGCWKFNFTITGKNYIFKYINIENGYFLFVIFHNITVYLIK